MDKEWEPVADEDSDLDFDLDLVSNPQSGYRCPVANFRCLSIARHPRKTVFTGFVPPFPFRLKDKESGTC